MILKLITVVWKVPKLVRVRKEYALRDESKYKDLNLKLSEKVNRMR